MAEYGMPFDFDPASPDPEEYQYSAVEEQMFNAAQRTNGVYPQVRIVKNNILEPDMYVGQSLRVSKGDGLSVIISPGLASVMGVNYINTDAKTITFAQSGQERTYDIVIQLSYIGQKIHTVEQLRPDNTVITDALLRRTDTYQMAIATVNIPAGATAILESNITDQRLNTLLCPDGRPVCGLVGSAAQADTRMIVDAYRAQLQENWAIYSQWIGGAQEDFAAEMEKFAKWFAGAKSTLDEDSAGQLYSRINNHEQTAVTEPDGVHGLRNYDGILQVSLDGEWQSTRSGGYPPGDLISLTATPGDGSATLFWQDPDDVSYQGISLSRWAGTRLLRKTGDYPSNEKDGLLVLDSTTRNQYQSTGFVDKDLVNDTTYYYRAFPYSDKGLVNTSGSNRITTLPGELPPDNVTSFTATAGNAQVTLKWGDPTLNWAGTRIVRKAGSYPTGVTDGTAVLTSTTRDQYKTTGYVDKGLTNNTAYYYQAFPYSDVGTYNTNVANRATATPKNPVPTFTYTGTFSKVDSTHPTNGSERFYAILKTSGTLTFGTASTIDIFAVGGGSGGGGPGGASVGNQGWGGGSGGYTKNLFSASVATSGYAITIGAGGAEKAAGGTTTFGSLITASGGSATSNYNGANGGSGGGAGSGGAGGSNGGNGNATANYSGGTGQGTSTRPFSGTVAPFNSMIYAGGGGGGGFDGATGGSGGSGGGGGGGSRSSGSKGTANTGGGGGGAGGMYATSIYGGSGGSGVVIIRWGDWSA